MIPTPRVRSLFPQGFGFGCFPCGALRVRTEGTRGNRMCVFGFRLADLAALASVISEIGAIWETAVNRSATGSCPGPITHEADPRLPAL
jgi:hypothetical protein